MVALGCEEIRREWLQELYVTLTRKVRRPLPAEQAVELLHELRAFPLALTDYPLIAAAIEHALRFRISCWDGTIIAAAETLGAPVVYSEDLSHRQSYGSVRVENRFLKTERRLRRTWRQPSYDLPIAMPSDTDQKPDRIAFDISPEQRQQAEETIRAIREDAESKDHVTLLIDTVNELTDTGLDFYFLHPLEAAKIGWSSMSAARLGVAAARRGIPTVVRRVVSSMTPDQRRVIAEFLERILIRS